VFRNLSNKLCRENLNTDKSSITGFIQTTGSLLSLLQTNQDMNTLQESSRSRNSSLKMGSFLKYPQQQSILKEGKEFINAHSWMQENTDDPFFDVSIQYHLTHQQITYISQNFFGNSKSTCSLNYLSKRDQNSPARTCLIWLLKTIIGYINTRLCMSTTLLMICSNILTSLISRHNVRIQQF